MLMNILDNEAFSQVLTSELDFEAKRKSLKRISCKTTKKGKKVYGKSGKALKGMYVRK
tara:strand:- start:600 stop:773 length:174 start_codon:yes stop_codon:yes gene_type:complete